MKNKIVLLIMPLVASFADAQTVQVMQGIEAHIGLILLIASIVIIILMILIILFLHNIAEHLNWIRRIR